jgi:hypothetical protein
MFGSKYLGDGGFDANVVSVLISQSPDQKRERLHRE